uniref:Uncharacterized protein n=1 Tax=Oryza sativa subsp. japonica TaxID=39947 RepID=Q6H433_ORYSJ|nr:hypothetical protein [Oryza sativa Japonica Group]
MAKARNKVLQSNASNDALGAIVAHPSELGFYLENPVREWEDGSPTTPQAATCCHHRHQPTTDNAHAMALPSPSPPMPAGSCHESNGFGYRGVGPPTSL